MDNAEEVKSVRRETSDRTRQRLYRRAIWIAILGNGLLAAAKGVVAWLSGSSAVLSDAANSLSDMLYSLLMAGGLYVSQQPADRGHPQGHERFEPLVSIFIALMMGLAGAAALREGWRSFVTGATGFELGWPLVVLLGSIAVKLLMCLVVRRIGQRARSPAIRASARDNLGDVMASSAALVGVVGSRFVHPLLDPAMGMLVSLWIFRAGWEIFRENLGYLTGCGAPPEVMARIVDAASSVPGVLDVHQVIADYVGPRLRVDMHVDVAGEVTLYRAHAIADEVQASVEELPEVDLVFVHVEPV